MKTCTHWMNTFQTFDGQQLNVSKSSIKNLDSISKLLSCGDFPVNIPSKASQLISPIVRDEFVSATSLLIQEPGKEKWRQSSIPLQDHVEVKTDIVIENRQKVDKSHLPCDIVFIIVHGIGASDRTLANYQNNLKTAVEEVLQRWYWADRPIIHEIRCVYWKPAIRDFVGKHQMLMPEVNEGRQAAQSYVGDIIYFLTPHLGDQIVLEAHRGIEAAYAEIKADPRLRSAKVCLIAHSLGSIITYELISGLRFRSGLWPGCSSTNPVTGEAYDHNAKNIPPGPKLSFKPDAFFMWGSPASAFLSMQKEGFETKCPRLKGIPHFNVFHPQDPVAFRFEGLLFPDKLAARKLPSPPILVNWKNRGQCKYFSWEDSVRSKIASAQQTWQSTLRVFGFGGVDDPNSEENLVKRAMKAKEKGFDASCLELNRRIGDGDANLHSLGPDGSWIVRKRRDVDLSQVANSALHSAGGAAASWNWIKGMLVNNREDDEDSFEFRKRATVRRLHAAQAAAAAVKVGESVVASILSGGEQLNMVGERSIDSVSLSDGEARISDSLYPDDSVLTPEDNQLDNSWSGPRIDFSLQAEDGDKFMKHLAFMRSHMSYWGNRDLAFFMLRVCLRGSGFHPCRRSWSRIEKLKIKKNVNVLTAADLNVSLTRKNEKQIDQSLLGPSQYLHGNADASMSISAYLRTQTTVVGVGGLSTLLKEADWDDCSDEGLTDDEEQQKKRNAEGNRVAAGSK